MLETLTRVGSCVTSATSGTLLPVFSSSASLSLCLACTSGCSVEAWRLRWEDGVGVSCTHGRRPDCFSLSVSKFPFLLQLWVPFGTRLTPPSLRPCSLVYVLSTSHPNCHHVPNPVTFISCSFVFWGSIWHPVKYPPKVSGRVVSMALFIFIFVFY